MESPQIASRRIAVALLCVLGLTYVLAACGGDDETKKSDTSATSSSLPPTTGSTLPPTTETTLAAVPTTLTGTFAAGGAEQCPTIVTPEATYYFTFPTGDYITNRGPGVIRIYEEATQTRVAVVGDTITLTGVESLPDPGYDCGDHAGHVGAAAAHAG